MNDPFFCQSGASSGQTCIGCSHTSAGALCLTHRPLEGLVRSFSLRLFKADVCLALQRLAFTKTLYPHVWKDGRAPNWSNMTHDSHVWRFRGEEWSPSVLCVRELHWVSSHGRKSALRFDCLDTILLETPALWALLSSFLEKLCQVKPLGSN